LSSLEVEFCHWLQIADCQHRKDCENPDFDMEKCPWWQLVNRSLEEPHPPKFNSIHKVRRYIQEMEARK